jgi:hypothetical protein
MQPITENEVYAEQLYIHLAVMAERLRRIPADKWDFAFAPPAPTPRILATHAWQWLVCDRQHINEPDASKHPHVPEPPDDQQALCDLLENEAKTWRDMILAMSPETLSEERRQFNDRPMNIRAFVAHMLQNGIYKHGQLSTIYFALGLDGDEPYLDSCPFPNPIYDEIFGPKG